MIPAAAAFLDLERSNKSTPSQESKWQLSGPAIPGVQISDVGNLLLTTSKACTSFPRLLASCGASTSMTIEGSSD